MAIRDDSGQIQGVRYDELAPMLLNEMQRMQGAVSIQTKVNVVQVQALEVQSAEIHDLKQQVAELRNLKEEMRATLQQLKAKERVVALR